MKISQICKILSFTLVVWLIPAMPTLGNTFYDLLPDAKRKEIKIIDDHTVEVGMGPDNQSVSCNILDALQSIPSVGPGQEPETVFVNKEKVYHFHKGLYTWDKEGKYRVRLTTKYIREFGNIRIFVPKEGDAIDPDDSPVSTTITHAVKSIPSAKEDTEPKKVFVNGKRVYHIKEEPVANFKPIAPPEKESANQNEQSSSPEQETSPSASLIEKPEKKFQEQDSTNEKPSVALSPEIIVPPSPSKGKLISPPSPPVQKKKKIGIVKGFRLAKFGMNEQQIIQAVETDFDLPEKEIEMRKIPESGQRVLTIASLRLDPENGKARINYYLASHDQRLNRVDVVWGHSEHSSVDISILKNSAEKFKNLFNQFRQLQAPAPNNHATKEPYIFYGLDTFGNGIKVMWAKPLDNNFQPINNLESTLALSSFQSNSKALNH